MDRNRDGRTFLQARFTKISFEKIYPNVDIDWIDSISLCNRLQIREISQEYALFSDNMKIKKKDDIEINLVKNLIFWEQDMDLLVLHNRQT